MRKRTVVPAGADCWEVSLTGGRTAGHLTYVNRERWPRLGGRRRVLVCVDCSSVIARKCEHVAAVRKYLAVSQE